MTIVRLTGDDTIIINDRPLSDFGPGEIAKLTFATDLVTVKTGKNGNTIFAKNATGNQAELELKLLRGSGDDAALNTQLNLYNSDFGPAGYVLMNGSITKNLGEGDGKIKHDTYSLTGGVIKKKPEMTANVEGDVEQALVTYNITFAIAPRTLS